MGYPVPHARFLKDQVQGYETIDIWGDNLLNTSTYGTAAHDNIAKGIASIATGGGVRTIAVERHIPYCESTSRKLLKRKCERSTEVWKYCLGFAERDYKHTNLVCWVKKYRAFYVGNISFKAKASDMQQAFEKNLSMKVDSAVITRDSAGKSRGCAFVTLRWKEFHEHNPGYNRDKEPATLWTEHLSHIMRQQSVCDRQIYMEDVRSQRQS